MEYAGFDILHLFKFGIVPVIKYLLVYLHRINVVMQKFLVNFPLVLDMYIYRFSGKKENNILCGYDARKTDLYSEHLFTYLFPNAFFQ